MLHGQGAYQRELCLLPSSQLHLEGSRPKVLPWDPVYELLVRHVPDLWLISGNLLHLPVVHYLLRQLQQICLQVKPFQSSAKMMQQGQ